ncbi:TRAP transporter large permease [Deinococcus knuensis]|uniref:TRAP transporter large permease n=1 Tax=Deinococcus knuensis TaxID=1837380 RepID=UPI001E28CB32|nr:TRAP transporter large permease subunit [Deinococcus knuensis]
MKNPALETPVRAASAQPRAGALRRAEQVFAQGLSVLTGALLVAIVLIISWQVVARYVPGLSSPHWTEELSLTLLVWLGLIATALGIRNHDTLRVSLLVERLPVPAQVTLHRLVWLVVAAFGLYLLRYGWELSRSTMAQFFPTLRLPVGWMYLALPAGGALIAAYAARNVLGAFTPAPPGPQARRVALVCALACALLLLAALLNPAALLGPAGLLVGTFFVLLAAGTPVGVAVGMATLVSVARFGMPELIVAQRMANGVTSTPLLAIPFFILVGQIMSEGGIARRLVDLARVLVGPWKGGLAMVNVLDSMLMGGVSGSAVADVSATGGVIIPMMVKKGYDRDFATAITVASSVQGVIIPPSHNMVIYSLAAGGVSIGTMFLAGYLPGILTGVALMISAYLLSVRRNYPTEPRPPLRESLRIVGGAVPSLLVGLIVVGGIVFGWFTATESAAIGVLAALLVSTVFYRELTWASLWRSVQASVATVGMVMFIIATASAFSWMMALLRVPADLSALILGVSDNPLVVLLLLNLLMLVLGMFMDMGPLIVILTPVLLPIVTAEPIGMSAVQFGIVMMLNLGLGLTTPPVGTALFVGCGVGQTTMEKVSRAMLYFWPPMFVALLLVTYFPWFVEFIPSLVQGR